MSVAPKKGTFNIVRQFHLDADKLKYIAEALGISEAERDRIIYAEIVISPPLAAPGGGPETPSGGTRPSRERARPSPTRRRRPRSE
jgi:hypothetical protein